MDTVNAKYSQFGLIAEEVANVNPNLVVRDHNEETYTVRYEAVDEFASKDAVKILSLEHYQFVLEKAQPAAK